MSISFKEDIVHERFTRTRHSSLRCFPTCSPKSHKSNSFCGGPLYVDVTLTPELSESITAMDYVLYGEFLLETEKDNVGKGTEERIKARMFKHQGNVLSFIFMPPGKWNYKGKVKSSEKHVFTVTFEVGDKVMSHKSTKPFQIVPIWKVGGGGNTLEKPTSSSSSSNPVEEESYHPHHHQDISTPPVDTPVKIQVTPNRVSPPSQPKRPRLLTPPDALSLGNPEVTTGNAPSMRPSYSLLLAPPFAQQAPPPQQQQSHPRAIPMSLKLPQLAPPGAMLSTYYSPAALMEPHFGTTAAAPVVAPPPLVYNMQVLNSMQPKQLFRPHNTQ